MKIWKIIEFELYYRARRPATYLYFLILFVLAFLGISVDAVTIGSSAGQVKQNAPTEIAFMMVILTAIPGFFISSAIMGVPVLRDYMHNSYEIIFTRPVSKIAYLMGRFLGSLIILLCVFSGILLGFMAGTYAPWLDPDNYLPFNSWHFIQPFFIFTIPNIFFTGALFFWGGVYNRSILWVFVQGVILLALYFISGAMTNNWDSRTYAAILDPIGVSLLNIVSRYWTVVELNSRIFNFSGLIFVNRMVWLTLAGGILLFTYFSFDPVKVRRRWWNRRRRLNPIDTRKAPAFPAFSIPQVVVEGGAYTRLYQLGSLCILYVKEILLAVPFLAITIVGIVNIFINSRFFNQIYGTEVYPTTSLMIELISSFSLFYLIIITFYSGELIWREKDIKLDSVFDSLPIAPWLILTSKFLGICVILFVLHIILILLGMAIQTLRGYYHYEPMIYLQGLLIGSYSTYILFAALAFFIQILTRNKFLGHTLFILFFIVNVLLDQFGLEHRMIKYASGGWDMYSDMNGFGHFIIPFISYRIYWLGVAMVMAGISLFVYKKQRKSSLKTQIRSFKIRSYPISTGLILTGILLSLSSGTYIYFNTEIINQDRNSKQQKQYQAAYERSLKHLETKIQPKIKAVEMNVDLYPEQRDFEADGCYILKNQSNSKIADIHIQLRWDHSLILDTLYFDRPHQLIHTYDSFYHYVYRLDNPLLPGDSIEMNFREHYDSRGFREHQVNNEIVENGTFMRNDYFPSLGYQPNNELQNRRDREDYGLPLTPRMRGRRDSLGIQTNIFGDDGDYIRFEIKLSTAYDQIALAPGRLVNAWEEANRAHFYYKMERPMINFWSIVSARYVKLAETMQIADVNTRDSVFRLEIYYHPGHEYNVKRMMKGMQRSLAYYSKHFSPYQFLRLRIMEFPRYSYLVQSFANTIPFSEGLGFVIDVKERDIDMAFYITAHEVAHQWWGHQVLEANVRGSAFLSESLSQYSALMVMKAVYGEAMMQNYLKYELDQYLKGRASEDRNELPLALVANQNYIHYHKGAMVMYALQDYISEDSVNSALRKYCRDWGYQTGRYATSDILLEYFRNVTPDSLSYIIYELFESITLYENRVVNPSYRQRSGLYEVNIPVNSLKYQVDSLGNEKPILINDWIDIGIVGRAQNGEDSLLYLNKHLIDTSYVEINVTVNSRPLQAGIDPIYKLIDRNPEDNIAPVIEVP